MSDPIEVEPLIVLSEVCGASVTAMKHLITSIQLDGAILESCFKTVPYYPYVDAPMLWRAWLSRGDSGTTMIKRWVGDNPSIASSVANESMTHHFLLLTKKKVGWADLDTWMRERDLEITDLTLDNASLFSQKVGIINTEGDFAAFVKCIAALKGQIDSTNTTSSLLLISAALGGSSNPAFDQELLLPFLMEIIRFAGNDSGKTKEFETFFNRNLFVTRLNYNPYRCGWLGRALYADPDQSQSAIDAYRSILPFDAEKGFIEAWRDSLLSASSSRPDRNSYEYLVPWMENCLESLDRDLYDDFIHIFPPDGRALDPTYNRDLPSWTYFYVQWAPSPLDPPLRFKDVSNWMKWASGDLERRVTRAALDALVLRMDENKDEKMDPDYYNYTDAMIDVLTHGFKQKKDKEILIGTQNVLGWLENSFFLNGLSGNGEDVQATLPKLVWDSFLPEARGGTGFCGDYSTCLYFALHECFPETTIDPENPDNRALAQEYVTYRVEENEVPHIKENVDMFKIFSIRMALEHFGAGIAPQGLLEKFTAYLEKEQKKAEKDQEQSYIDAMEEVIAILSSPADAPRKKKKSTSLLSRFLEEK